MGVIVIYNDINEIIVEMIDEIKIKNKEREE